MRNSMLLTYRWYKVSWYGLSTVVFPHTSLTGWGIIKAPVFFKETMLSNVPAVENMWFDFPHFRIWQAIITEEAPASAFIFTSKGQGLQSAHTLVCPTSLVAQQDQGRQVTVFYVAPQPFLNDPKKSMWLYCPLLLLYCTARLLQGIEIFEWSTCNAEWFIKYCISKACAWNGLPVSGFTCI